MQGQGPAAGPLLQAPSQADHEPNSTGSALHGSEAPGLGRARPAWFPETVAGSPQHGKRWGSCSLGSPCGGVARAQCVTSRAQGQPGSHHRTANKVSPRHVLMRGHWPSGPWGHSLHQGQSQVPHLQQAAKNMSCGVFFFVLGEALGESVDCPAVPGTGLLGTGRPYPPTAFEPLGDHRPCPRLFPAK